jgi:putative spermidine/putrescine transport system substrate-binding protein
LLADGVAPDELYPLDLERAKAMVDTIDDALVFSESPGDEVVSGAASMAVAAPTDVDINGAFEVQWRGQFLEAEYFVVPIGAPNGQAAMEFIAWTACATNNALPSGSGGEAWGPTNLLAEPLAERTDLMGMANLDETSVFRDDEALAAQWADIEEVFAEVRADR